MTEFNRVLGKNDNGMPVAVAAINALTRVIKLSNATTMYEVQEELKKGTAALKEAVWYWFYGHRPAFLF